MMTASSEANLSSNSFVEPKNREFMLSILASFAFWCRALRKPGRRAHSRYAETQQWRQRMGTILSPADCRVYDVQARLWTNEAQQKHHWKTCNLAYQQTISKQRHGEKLAMVANKTKKSSVKEKFKEK